MRSSVDPDARGRIRDTAIQMIGRDGFASTSLRAVARAAGVSPGLVVHHFGSWEGLLSACDEHVLAQAAAGWRGAAIRGWLADVDANRTWLDYARRLLMEDRPAGDRLFDELLEHTRAQFAEGVQRSTVQPSRDPDTRAVLLTAYGLACLVLERHVGRALGEPELNCAAVRRLAGPALELYTRGLYASPPPPGEAALPG